VSLLEPMTMARLAVFALLVAVLAPAAPGRAMPPREAATFAYTSVEVKPDDVLTRVCDAPARDAALVMDAWSIAGVAAGWGLSPGDTDYYLSAKVGSQSYERSLAPGSGGAWHGWESAQWAIQEQGRFRAALAAWGGDPFKCTFRLNGVVVGRSGDPSKARYLLSSDFSVGAGAGITNLGAAGALALEHQVAGYVFAFIPIDAGTVVVHRPDGGVEAPWGGTDGAVVASDQDGRWTYVVSAARRGGIWGGVMVFPE